MSAISVTYSFTNATTSDATQVNQNFQDIITGLSDGSKTLTVSSVVASTLTLSGAVTFSGLTASLPVFTNASKVLASNAMTGSGSVMLSVSPSTTGTLDAANGTFSGTLGVTGIQTNNQAITFGANGTSATLSLFKSSTSGLTLRGGTGSTNDFALLSASGTVVLRNPTGTNNIETGAFSATTGAFTGAATFSSTISAAFWNGTIPIFRTGTGAAPITGSATGLGTLRIGTDTGESAPTGSSSGQQVQFDPISIQAMTAATPSLLKINPFGGTVELGGALKLSSANTVNSSTTNTITNKVKINVGGTDYYFLVSTSNA